jgi:nitroreductase/uncharacterized protein YdhG (YjbR/CyaY superfamily)
MDFFKAVERRRSVRKFKPNPISSIDLKKILEAARLAPSGSNRQPWYFIVIRDLETKKLISVAANNQAFIAEADTVIVALGNSSAITSGGKVRRSLTRLPHRQDPMIAVEHMVLAATALGYGTCWIGAFDEGKVKEILKVPESLEVITLLPVGVPDENPSARSRKTFSEIFFNESYGIPLVMKKALKDVDEYIARAPKEVQGKLKEFRAAIREAAPTAVERISYGMPYYDYKGRLAYFRLSKEHIGLYIPPPVIEEYKNELADYETAKATVRFPLDKKLPVTLIKKLVKARMKKNEAKK